MEVKAWPVDPEMAAQQRNMQEQLVENQRTVLMQLVEILNRLATRHDADGSVAANAVAPVQQVD